MTVASPVTDANTTLDSAQEDGGLGKHSPKKALDKPLSTSRKARGETEKLEGDKQRGAKKGRKESEDGSAEEDRVKEQRIFGQPEEGREGEEEAGSAQEGRRGNEQEEEDGSRDAGSAEAPVNAKGKAAADSVRKAEDPRVRNGKKALVKHRGTGRNTESFDPKSTLVRPDMRIYVGSKSGLGPRLLRHDDAVIVPDFFCEASNWEMYNALVREMRSSQAEGVAKSEWISWHEGAHLISMNPSGSPTYQRIVQALREYFHISNENAGTRFNWYSDVDDWKPFHHDSAAFNPERAKRQNITVGVSFGANRELAFLHAKTNARLYFPQTNGSIFSFGRDVNIQWKHGINALTDEEKRRELEYGKSRCDPDVPVGRISIILWGQCEHVLEEEGSPPMLSGGKGHHMHHAQGGARRNRSNDRSDSRARQHDAAPRPDSRDRGRGSDRGREERREDRKRGRSWERSPPPASRYDASPAGGDHRGYERSSYARRADHAPQHYRDRAHSRDYDDHGQYRQYRR